MSVLGSACGGETVTSNPKGCVYDGGFDCDPGPDAATPDAGPDSSTD